MFENIFACEVQVELLESVKLGNQQCRIRVKKIVTNKQDYSFFYIIYEETQTIDCVLIQEKLAYIVQKKKDLKIHKICLKNSFYFDIFISVPQK